MLRPSAEGAVFVRWDLIEGGGGGGKNGEEETGGCPGAMQRGGRCPGPSLYPLRRRQQGRMTEGARTRRDTGAGSFYRPV